MELSVISLLSLSLLLVVTASQEHYPSWQYSPVHNDPRWPKPTQNRLDFSGPGPQNLSQGRQVYRETPQPVTDTTSRYQQQTGIGPNLVSERRRLFEQLGQSQAPSYPREYHQAPSYPREYHQAPISPSIRSRISHFTGQPSYNPPSRGTSESPTPSSRPYHQRPVSINREAFKPTAPTYHPYRSAIQSRPSRPITTPDGLQAPTSSYLSMGSQPQQTTSIPSEEYGRAGFKDPVQYVPDQYDPREFTRPPYLGPRPQSTYEPFVPISRGTDQNLTQSAVYTPTKRQSRSPPIATMTAPLRSPIRDNPSRLFASDEEALEQLKSLQATGDSLNRVLDYIIERGPMNFRQDILEAVNKRINYQKISEAAQIISYKDLSKQLLEEGGVIELAAPKILPPWHLAPWSEICKACLHRGPRLARTCNEVGRLLKQ